MAIIGLSRDEAKASHQVAKYLKEHGYKIVPINPTTDRILGEKAYRSLLETPAEIQESIEVIDIFRPSEEVTAIVDQAISLKKFGKLQGIWMQLGIENHEAAEKAKKAGLTVIMNKCMMVEHGRLHEEKDIQLEKIRAKKIRKLMSESSKENIDTPIITTDKTFDEMIKKNPFAVIDCWAPWCGPCRMMSPIIDELAREYAGKIVFGKLNVDENPEIATRYNIMGIPTLLIVKNGAVVDRIVGAAPKPLIINKLGNIV